MHTYTRIHKRGFTIIELLVVIVIIGLLVSIVTTSLVNAQRQARDGTRKTTVQNIANAVESFYAVNKRFPGRQSTATDGHIADTGKTYPCEAADIDNGGGNYSYLYLPLNGSVPGSSTSIPCNDPTRAISVQSDGYSYLPADYNPTPAWVPGLGAYLNPFPIEANYQGKDGTPTAYPQEVLAADDQGTNKTRTYEYRHLIGGYFVATRLEGNSSDTNTFNNGKTFSNGPYFYKNDSTTTPPNTFPVTVSGTNIYIVLK